ncbi:MAG: hypothetical protein GY920_18210 [Aliivibrio sp.]|nr:hypothetical protein [Aliivibrio sp.]
MDKAKMIETIFSRTDRLLERAELIKEVYGNNSPEHNEARGRFDTAMNFIYDLELSDDYTEWVKGLVWRKMRKANSIKTKEK